MKTIIKLIPLFILFINFSTYSEKLTVAVSDLKAEGVEQSTAKIISERLRSELLNTGVFRVMERAEMASILKEQGFQKTGACDEQSCAVEMGKLLGVARMAAGTIGKIDQLYTISLRLIDVTTGEVLLSVSEDCYCTVEELLSGSTRSVAAKFRQGVAGDIKQAQLAGKTGDLYIITAIPGASVTIDGNPVQGVTPLTIRNIAAGDHDIAVTKDQFFGGQHVYLVPDDLLKINLEMIKGKGNLKIFTEPSGAVVVIDNEKTGETPLKLNDIFAGPHSMTIRAPNYLDAQSVVFVAMGETRTVTVKLTPCAYLTINSNSPYAVFSINNSEIGRGIVMEKAVPSGTVRLLANAPDYETYEDSLFLVQGEQKKIKLNLVRKTATVKISTKPADVGICCDTTDLGMTPFINNRMLPGAYCFKLSHPCYDLAICSLKVEKNKDYDTTINMQWKYGDIEINTKPVTAALYLNDSCVGVTPHVDNLLLPGKYRLRIDKHFYNTVIDSFSLSKNDTIRKTYTLNYTRQYLDSIKVRKAAASKLRINIIRTCLGVASAVGWGYSVYQNHLAQNYTDECGKIQNEYNAATSGFDEIRARYNTKKTLGNNASRQRNVGYAVASALTLTFGISFVF
jgi:hypothetical protein